MAEVREFYVYRKNVPYYNVGVRRNIWDADGVLLTQEFPTVRIEAKDHNDFKRANKRPIQEGLIRLVDDEAMDWEIVNELSDEEALELLKNYARLKSQLQKLDSLAMVQKLYQFAVEKDSQPKTLSLVKARLDELTPDEDFYTKVVERNAREEDDK